MINLYGLMIGLGAFLGIGLTEKVQKRLQKYCREYAEIKIDKVLPFLAIGVLVGARAYHVVDYWEYYQRNLGEIIKIWRGGMAIWGGILGGIVSLVIIYRNEIKKIILALDLLVFGTLAAQIMGRLGNFFNQELYGKPTELDWGIYIRPENRLVGFENVERYHPLFFYEMVLNSLLLGLMLWMMRKKRKMGVYFYSYLIGYGMIRLGLDFFRIEAWIIAGLGVSQWIGLLMIGLGGIGMGLKLELKDENR